ncbi:MAG: alpha/beta hydrolase [Bacteroidales bacterium]
MIQAQNLVLPLWEGNPPNSKASSEKEIRDTTSLVFVRQVQVPDVAVYLPSPGNATGEAVVVCPGGGYSGLAYDWEGVDIARMLSARGIAAIVLKYRLPGEKSNIEPHKSPLLDAQRALRLVRHHAREWRIDPARIGIMGFSAGGHLASTLSTHFDKGDPGSADPVERESCRPDFSVLMYPVITFTQDFMHRGSRDNLLGTDPDPDLVRSFSNELQVGPDTPPAILIHASDDAAVPVENSLEYYKALLENDIPAELHVYPYGGHGFSLANGKGHLATWPDRVVDWIRYITK